MPNMTKIITPAEFCDAWRAKWDSLSEQTKQTEFADEFAKSPNTPWTKKMLGPAGGEYDSFLECVVRELNANANIEYEGGLRVDMRVVGDKKINHPNLGYPLLLDILIEHENGQDVENEMWKLIFLRSPLKVIIFYSHEPKDKLGECWQMLDKANAAFPENPDTRYLFIIGNLLGDTPPYTMQWRWSSDKEPMPQFLCGEQSST